MMGQLRSRFGFFEKPSTRELFRKCKPAVERLEEREVPASLAGQVYIDANLDGFKQASESGLAGVEIVLTGTDANGAVNETATTDASGNFSFNSLLAGTYTITQTQPTGFITATDTLGNGGGTVAANEFSNIVLGGSQAATGYLFGERGIRVSGRAFNDLNANGVFDGADFGRAGVLITLNDAGRGTSFPTLTDVNGNFNFEGLAPGSYTLVATNADPALGFTTLATQNVAIGNTGAPGGEITDQDFGLSATGEIRGVVYRDNNFNGVFDAGDVGINNVQIRLAGTQANSQSVNVTQNTSPDGTFRFTGVLAGNYSLTETQPAGFDEGSITVGSAGGTAGPNVIVGINLGSGVVATGYHFGERLVQTSSISGRVFIDMNGDGQKQANEPGLNGVVIQLTGTNDLGDPVNQSVNTDASGNFTFTGLRPGTYNLAQTQPANFGTGITSAGSAGGTVVGDAINGIVLGSGVNATDYRFAEIGNQATGLVFNDTNGNGVQDGGELGRAGVLLTLTNISRGVSFNAVSDANGNFTFADLGPGSYTLTATNPDGANLGFTTQTVLNFSIPDEGVVGNVVANQNFGLSAFGELSGRVFNDRNSNGVFDAGDVGIGNIQIRLQGVQANGTGVDRTVTTQANGTYQFDDVLTGTYSLTETQPSNFDDGAITVGTAGGVAATNVVTNIALGAGVFGSGYNFGELEVLFSTLAGRVFVDSNGDGQFQTGEPGIGSVVLSLVGTANNGDAVNLSVTTATDGTFTFSNVRPGTYTLSQAQPANFGNGQTTAGTAGGNVVGDVVSNIVLGNSVNATGYLFGEVGNQATGQVFNDTNGNGVRDGGELGRAGVLLTLTNTSTNTTTNVISDANGNFTFANLGPGSYTLTAANPDANNLGFTTGGTLNFTIPAAGQPGGVVQDQNFGLSAFAEVSGTVFNDRNGNGIFDAGDVGIGNVQIRLQGTQANGTSVNRTLTTQANGTYRFEDVLAGTYSVTETQPTAFDDGTITVGTAGGTAATNAVTNIVLAPGVIATGYNFGELEVLFSTLSGRVFIDRNSDGLFQTGEQGIQGVVLSLVGTANNGDAVNLSTTTAADGTYSFSNVRPGTYTLTESQPANFGNGSARAGTAGGIVNGDSISNIVLSGGLPATDYLFSEIGNRIAGTVFDDANANGVFDGGEQGRANVTVNLTGGGQNLTVVSDGNGDYQFVNLGPGTYTITASAPTGQVISTASISVTIPAAGLPGGEAIDRDIGLTQTSSLVGVAFVDLNNDGVQQANEVGFEGLTMVLQGITNGGQNVTRQNTTGEFGGFNFENLVAGTYNLTPNLPPGVTLGQITVGSAGGVAGTTNITGIQLGAGQTANGYRFAVLSAADRGIVMGNVFLDRNGNRMRDAGDIREEDFTAGISGVTIQLFGRDFQNNLINLSTTTDSVGNYIFTNLLPGRYSIREIQPAFFREGRTFRGTLGGILSRNRVDKMNLVAGAIGTGYDFSELLPSRSRRQFIASRYLT